MKTFKTLCIAFAAIFIFSNSTCKKKVKIEKDVDGAEVTMTALPQSAGTFDFTQNVKFDLDALLKQYDLSINDLTSVEPVSATITIIDSTATPVSFDIVDNVSVELASSSIPNKRVIYKDPVPHTGLSVISPDIDTTTDFLALAQANDITYHFKGTLNKALSHAVQMKVAIKWHVVGQI
jgi:hypothetical protein